MIATARFATDTAAFRRWFGKSVVREADGTPKLVYHGTPERGFEVFDPGRAGARTRGGGLGGPALYFTDDRRVAAAYAEGGRRKAVLRVYLRIEDPLVVDAEGGSWVNVFPEVVDVARREGRDGVVVFRVRDTARSWDDRPSTVYVVFDARQVKHATLNRGDFDPEDPRMSFNRTGSRAKLSLADLVAGARASGGERPSFSVTSPPWVLPEGAFASHASTAWGMIQPRDRRNAARLLEQVRFYAAHEVHTVLWRRHDELVRRLTAWSDPRWPFGQPFGYLVHNVKGAVSPSLAVGGGAWTSAFDRSVQHVREIRQRLDHPETRKEGIPRDLDAVLHDFLDAVESEAKVAQRFLDEWVARESRRQDILALTQKEHVRWANKLGGKATNTGMGFVADDPLIRYVEAHAREIDLPTFLREVEPYPYVAERGARGGGIWIGEGHRFLRGRLPRGGPAWLAVPNPSKGSGYSYPSRYLLTPEGQIDEDAEREALVKVGRG